MLLFQDLIRKWETYVVEHKTYKDLYLVFMQWVGDARDKLNACKAGAKQASSASSDLEVSEIFFQCSCLNDFSSCDNYLQLALWF